MSIASGIARLAKGLKFLHDSNFRSQKIRQWSLPVFQRLCPNVEVIGVRGNDGNVVLLHAPDRYITLDYLGHGKNATSRLMEAISALESCSLPLGGVFLDVGSNIGTETLTALISTKFSSALAIEPEVANFRLAKANVLMNGLEDRVTFVKAAVSNRAGHANLRFAKNNRGDHRIDTDCSQSESGAIPLITLDGLLEDLRLGPTDVSLVWIDVQGWEGYVLDGAKSLIFAKVPFVIEFCPQAMREAESYDMAVRLITSRFRSFVDLSRPTAGAQPIDEIKNVASRLTKGWMLTDLLLLH